MMRRSAGFHADEARRQLLKEWQNLPALELTANDYITCRVNCVDLKNRLSDIETNCRDRLHVWLLRIVGASTAPTSMAPRRQLLKEWQNVPALELTANDYITCRVNCVDLKSRLSDIETNCRDRLHVWLLRIVGASTAPTSMALPCRWRSRPQHQKRTHAPQQTTPSLDHLVARGSLGRWSVCATLDDLAKPVVSNVKFLRAWLCHRRAKVNGEPKNTPAEEPYSFCTSVNVAERNLLRLPSLIICRQFYALYRA